jgi:hypothetical protein
VTPTDSSNVLPGLQRLRRIRLEFWLGCLGWIAVNIIAVTVVARFDDGGLVTSVIQGLSTLGLAFLLGRAAYAKCPSCGETFAARGVWGNFFTRRCLHCGQGID